MRIYKVLLVLFLIQSCVAQKAVTIDLGEVTYSAKSRGGSKNITVVNGSVYFKTHTKTKTFFITQLQKESLKETISKLKLEEIGTLKVPSNRRAFDGAMHTRISIQLNNKTYISSDFDHDNPPKMLQPLVDLLESFIQ